MAKTKILSTRVGIFEEIRHRVNLPAKSAKPDFLSRREALHLLAWVQANDRGTQVRWRPSETQT